MNDTIPQDDIPRKRCSACWRWKPATTEFFGKQRSHTDGLRSWCKLCRKGEPHHENKETRHRYQVMHKEETRIRGQRWYQEHKEEHNLWGREYSRTHREQLNATSRNRRARKRSVAGVHTPDQIEAQLKRQHYRCYYAACGHAKFEKRNGKYVYHIDHTFPLVRVAGTDTPANDISYLVLTCPACNLSKNDKFPWEWPEGGRLL